MDILRHSAKRAGGSPAGRGGFTVVEVMVAMAVLSVEALSLLTLLISCQGLESVSHETALAVNAGRRVIEEIRQMAYADIHLGHVTPYFDVSQGDATLTPAENEHQCGRVEISEDAGAGTKEIVVTVSWRSTTGGDRRIQLACEVSDHL